MAKREIVSGEHRRITPGHSSPCDECGVTNWNLDENRGEVICNQCGLVVEQSMIDPGADWTNHDHFQDKSRVGAPLTYRLADRGLNTTISRSDLTSMGASRNRISSRDRRDWRRRIVVDERSKTRQSRARNLVKANQMIRDFSGLPNPMQEETARLYRKLSNEGFVTGRSIAGVAAACTYLVARKENIPRQISNEGFVTGRSIAGVAAACTYLVARKENIPRQIPEIADAYQIDGKELSRLIRHISRKYNMHTITSPSEYFDRFISELELPPNTRLQVDHLWQVIEPHSDIWQGKKPMGVAAALIYKAAKESGRTRTQAEICKISNISEVTLRGLLKLINGLLRRLGEASHN